MNGELAMPVSIMMMMMEMMVMEMMVMLVMSCVVMKGELAMLVSITCSSLHYYDQMHFSTYYHAYIGKIFFSTLHYTANIKYTYIHTIIYIHLVDFVLVSKICAIPAIIYTSFTTPCLNDLFHIARTLLKHKKMT